MVIVSIASSDDNARFRQIVQAKHPEDGSVLREGAQERSPRFPGSLDHFHHPAETEVVKLHYGLDKFQRGSAGFGIGRGLHLLHQRFDPNDAFVELVAHGSSFWFARSAAQ